MRAVVLGFALATALASAPASADSPKEAEKLYLEGVKLLTGGKLKEAAARFEQALAIERSAPLLFNLGQAQLKLGRLVAAKTSFTEAISVAKSKGPPTIVELATKSLAELEERIPTIAVDLPANVEGAVLKLDGKSVQPNAEGLSVDPGRHEVVVEAPGYDRYRESMDLREGDRERLRPKLRASQEPEPDTGGEVTSGRPLPIGPLVVGSVGVVAIGTAAYFFLKVRSLDDDRKVLWEKSGCPGPTCPSTEPDDARTLREDAEGKARVGNIFLGVGVAALAGGGVWYYFSTRPPKREQSTVSVTPVLGGAVVSGRF